MATERKELSAVRFAPRPHRPGATVTVVIPCYNYARFLPAAVGSVLSQQGVIVDVIIVDDASTDDSLNVANAIATADSRVSVLANASNAGAVTTFNRGLAEARGEFLVRLDADDLLTPGSLQRSVAVMQHLPDVGLVYGHPIHFTGAKLPTPRESVESWTLWSGQEWLAVRCVDGTNTITSPEVVMRKSVVDTVGGQRDLAHTHDMEMWLRMSTVADVAYLDGVDQAWHREHPDSLSNSAEAPIVILNEVRKAFDVLFSAAGESIHDSAELHEKAHRALASEALDQVWRQFDRGASADDVRNLLDFAASCTSDMRATRAWQDAARRAERASATPRILARLRGVLPRLRRRLRTRARYKRWSKTGEYEPMNVTDGTLPGRGFDSTPTGGMMPEVEGS